MKYTLTNEECEKLTSKDLKTLIINITFKYFKEAGSPVRKWFSNDEIGILHLNCLYLSSFQNVLEGYP